MSVNLEIRAEIVDVGSDIPRKSDIFLVDTNVWFWQTYTNASTTARPYQLKNYPNYLTQALVNGSTLSYSVLTLAELSSIIERTELDIYNKSNRVRLRPKEYRHNLPKERAKMVAEVQSAWSQVEAIAVSADLQINDDIAKRLSLAFRHRRLMAMTCCCWRRLVERGRGGFRSSRTIWTMLPCLRFRFYQQQKCH